MYLWVELQIKVTITLYRTCEACICCRYKLTWYAAMPRTCTNNANCFCYICGKMTFASQKRSITPMVKKAYHLYFGCKTSDQDKNWAPHICCNTWHCDSGSVRRRNQCHLLFPWCGVSQLTTPMIATSAWSLQLGKACPERKRGLCNIPILHLLCVQCLMEKDCQFLYLLNRIR